MGFFDWLLGKLFPQSRPTLPRRPGTVFDRTTVVSQSTASALPPRRSQGAPAAPKQRESVALKGLDTARFAPMSHSDVRKTARGMDSPWGNPWFGRRDLIPPPDDARTALIDRAMVGQGLITPEELTEIHEVGQEMDKVRPDLALAATQADTAVRRDAEERQRIKEQKKAEAAERKRQRAEEVARRRQTDIFHLGRGVSKGLADRRANVEKLQAAGLPVLATPADVAEAMGVSIPRLRWLTFHNEAASRVHYVRFTVPKKSGGTRELAAPHRSLAACQTWILGNVLAKVVPHDAAHGFVSGHSTLSNASPHVGREVVVNTDLTDFFPTVTFGRVKGIFQGMGYSPAVATIFALLCTESPRRTVEYDGQVYHVATGLRALPQGACTSPALSNLVARRLDARLRGICGKLGWTYTRYADDMTFSASGEAAGKCGYLLARVRHIVQDEGFAVNEKKTRVLRRNTAQSVTGVVVNQRPGVPRRTVRRLRAILHRARTEGLAAQNRANHPNFTSWLDGMIAYVTMVNPAQGRPLREQFSSLRGGQA